MAKSLTYTFNGRRNGGTHIDAKGFSGSGCDEAIKTHAEHMGGELNNVQHKEEYYEEKQQEREFE